MVEFILLGFESENSNLWLTKENYLKKNINDALTKLTANLFFYTLYFIIFAKIANCQKNIC